MEIIQAIVLGLVQGLTEFIPVSSSAHLVIVPWLFGWPDFGLSFDVMLHWGTLIAVLLYFRNDWVRYIRALFSGLPNFSPTAKVGLVAGSTTTADPTPDMESDRRVAWLLLIATIPGAIFGVLGESKIDAAFHEGNLSSGGIYVIGAALIIMGLVLALAERMRRGVGKLLPQITLPDAVTIGLAQALALIPGVSRSGATITAGLFRNINRAAAARFSFLLSAPIILGAGLKKIYDLIKDPAGSNPYNLSLVALAAGFLAAAISGYLAIAFLLSYLQRNTTTIFTLYRVVVGLLIIGLALFGLR